MSLTLASIGMVVGAIAKYIGASKGAEKAAEQAEEKLGEKGMEMLLQSGGKALSSIKNELATRQNPEAKKATTALILLENDPHDKGYQHDLATRLETLSTNDAAFAHILERLTTDATRADQTAGGIVMNDNARIYGAAVPVNYGEIKIDQTFGSDDH